MESDIQTENQIFPIEAQIAFWVRYRKNIVC